MSGFSWHVILRQVPGTGSTVTTDCNTAFTDAGGHTKLKLSYKLDQEQREDVNRSAKSLAYGFRQEVVVQFQIFTMADFVSLANVVTRLRDEDWQTFLSLDGGTTEIEVEIMSYSGPDTIRNKTIGGTFEVGLRGLVEVDEIPQTVEALG